MLARLARLGVVLALLAAAAPGGDCLSGSDCGNLCPLARKANTRLATGDEAVAVSETLRKDFAARVLGNLEAI